MILKSILILFIIMNCNKLNEIIIEFYYNYINYNKDRCYECKNVQSDTGNCECWYDTISQRKHK
jgi:hypothetical protein